MAETHRTATNASSQETWKLINRQGCRGYEVSSLGRIATYWRKGLSVGRTGDKKGGKGPSRRATERKILITGLERQGYLETRLVLHDEEDVTIRETWAPIHILVLEAFVGPRPMINGRKAEGRHLNDVRTDNRLENLAWGTHQDNVDDRERKGRNRPLVI